MTLKATVQEGRHTTSIQHDQRISVDVDGLLTVLIRREATGLAHVEVYLTNPNDYDLKVPALSHGNAALIARVWAEKMPEVVEPDEVPFEALSDDDKRFAADGWLNFPD